MSDRNRGSSCTVIIRAIWWFFPGLFLSGSYLAARYWYTPLLATFGLDTFAACALGVLAQVVVGIVWMLIEFINDNSIRTSIRALQVDGITSLFWSLTLSLYAMWSYCNDQLLWFFVAPVAMTIVEAGASIWFGMNNAGQKPVVQTVGVHA